MDVKEYIESGILEEYVSGLLTDEENRKIDELAGLYPEVQDEIDEIRASYNLLANRLGLAPDESILEKSLQSLRESEEMDETIQQPANVLNLRPFYTAIVACVVLLLVSSAFNFYLFSQLQNTQQDLTNLNTNLNFLQDAFNEKILLTGLPNSPESHATVYWNANSKDIYIHVGELPAPPSGHQYQLWAEKDGEMHNIGIFHHNNSIQHITEYAESADAFNVTLEVEGGSDEATVDRAYLRGAI